MDSLSSLLQEKVQPEKILHERGYRYFAGVDEAGRGPLAGPVVAAAVAVGIGIYAATIRAQATRRAAVT